MRVRQYELRKRLRCSGQAAAMKDLLSLTVKEKIARMIADKESDTQDTAGLSAER